MAKASTQWKHNLAKFFRPLFREKVVKPYRRAMYRLKGSVYRTFDRANLPQTRVSKSTRRVQHRWALVLRFLTWSGGSYFPLAPPISLSSPVFGPFLSRLKWVVATSGFKGGISWIKSKRLLFLKWLAQLADGEDDPSRRRQVRKVFGAAFVGLVHKTENRAPASIQMIRASLTVLNALRSFRLPPCPDYESISAPCGVEPWRASLDAKRGFWKAIGGSRLLRISRNLDRVWWTKFHFSVRSGPNGPALLTSLEDFLVLPKELREAIDVLGGPLFAQVTGHLDRIAPLFRDLFKGFSEDKEDLVVGAAYGVPGAVPEPTVRAPTGVPRKRPPKRRKGPSPRPFRERGEKLLRRLVALSDSEGKTRVVAILDYFSQTVLRRAGLWAFEILKRIPQDVTFAQGSFVEKVQGWGSGVVYHSIDLTSATDRFPIWFITDLFRVVLGDGWISSWEKVMVGYPFRCPDGHDRSYLTGNPMGAYSSWPFFAVAHHFVVYLAAQESGTEWKTARYVLLGDDILIGDPQLAQSYLRLLDRLGVGVAEAKTFVSKGFSEFAKRHLLQGVEVTGFPVSSVVDGYKSISQVVSAILGEQRKDLHPVGGVLGAIEDLDRSFLSGERFATFRQKRRGYAIQAEAVHKFLSSGKGDEDLLGVTKQLLYPYPWAREHPELWTDPAIARRLWLQACETALCKSAVLSNKKSPVYATKVVEATIERVIEYGTLHKLSASSFEQGRTPRIGPDGHPLPLVTVGYTEGNQSGDTWCIPLLGALARLSATTHGAVSDVLRGYRLDQDGGWPPLIRSIGYSLPDFLDSRAPDKTLRVSVSYRLAELIIREAKVACSGRDVTETLADFPGPGTRVFTLNFGPVFLGPLDGVHPREADWIWGVLKPAYGTPRPTVPPVDDDLTGSPPPK